MMISREGGSAAGERRELAHSLAGTAYETLSVTSAIASH